MKLSVIPKNCKWIVGNDIEAHKAAIREVDAQYCFRVLEMTPYFRYVDAVSKQMRKNTGVIASSAAFASSAENKDKSECKYFLEQKKSLENFYDSKKSILSVGDFTRNFADFFDAWNGLIRVDGFPSASLGNWAPLIPILNGIRKSLQNKNAFDKQTNRVRVKRWNVLSGYPSLGITNWRCPPEDVLGCIDRLLGYYETGDISGSTTDATFSICILHQFCDPANGLIADIDGAAKETSRFKDTIATQMNSGGVLFSFVSMVMQLHHSLPECMMALNLTPQAARKNDGANPIIFSPFLMNGNFSDEFNQIIFDWRTARSSVLGLPAGEVDKARALIVLQDVFQLSNMPTADSEIGLIIEFSVDDSYHPTKSEFGETFYNKVVSKLNTTWRGPAIPLQQVAEVLTSVFDNLDGVELPTPLNANPALADRINKVFTQEFPAFSGDNYPKTLGDMWRQYDGLLNSLNSVQRVAVAADYPAPRAVEADELVMKVETPAPQKPARRKSAKTWADDLEIDPAAVTRAIQVLSGIRGK